MERKVEKENIVPHFCTLFARSVSLAASTGKKQKVEKMLSFIFDPDFDAGKL